MFISRLTVAIALVAAVPCHAGINEIVETFDGGFDNEWPYRTNTEFSFDDTGLRFSISGEPPEGQAVIKLFALDLGRGSFKSSVEFDELVLGNVCPACPGLPPGSVGQVALIHEMSPFSPLPDVIELTVQADRSSPADEWALTVRSSGERLHFAMVPGATGSITLGLRFDEQQNNFLVDYGDGIDTLEFGPFSYSGPFSDKHQVTLKMLGSAGVLTRGLLDHFSLLPYSVQLGDFNGNGILDTADLDRLSTEVRDANNDARFDLNADNLVDDLDRTVWVHDLSNTWFGDTDLNGEFDSTDLVQVLSFGAYEDGVAMNSTWLTGDWDGNGDFTSGDLVFALADGGYEAGPRGATAGVPEPSSVVLLLLGVLGIGLARIETQRSLGQIP